MKKPTLGANKSNTHQAEGIKSVSKWVGLTHKPFEWLKITINARYNKIMKTGR